MINLDLCLDKSISLRVIWQCDELSIKWMSAPLTWIIHHRAPRDRRELY